MSNLNAAQAAIRDAQYALTEVRFKANSMAVKAEQLRLQLEIAEAELRKVMVKELEAEKALLVARQNLKKLMGVTT